jgi:sugar lactone lactonase YvrE
MSVITTAPLEVVAAGFTMTEGPRWHDGRLYFSDMQAGEVIAVDEAGRTELLARFDDKPSGLGFLPDGDLLIVLMRSGKVMRRNAMSGQVTLHADISGYNLYEVNDMAVDREGRAYVGQLGGSHESGRPTPPSPLIVIEPGGATGIAAPDMMGANGIALSPDGKRLITAEAAAWRIAQFDIGPGGTLSGRRLFADLKTCCPDGICLDAEGGVWAAIPFDKEAADKRGRGVLRIEEGGRVTHLAPTEPGRVALACMLGGPDLKTLYVCTTTSFKDAEARELRSARIERVRVEIPGVGMP